MLEEMRIFDRFVPDSMKWHAKEMYYAWQYFRKTIFRKGIEPILQVEVETNSSCNRHCKICPNHYYTRGDNYIDRDTYNNLLNQLAILNFSGLFFPCFYSEPLLDQNLEELLAMAKEKLPNAKLIVYTNGSLLTESRLDSLLQSGAHGLIVSQYQDNLPQDDLSDFLNKLPKELRSKIRYRILTDKQKLYNRGGLVQVENLVVKPRCYRASVATIIDYQGNVVLCSNDYFTKHTFGNINEEDLIKIWNKPNFKEVRKNLRKGVSENEMCKLCAGKEK